MHDFFEHCHELMRLALDEAKRCFIEDEIPVGAVLESPHGQIYLFRNKMHQTGNPLLHAEFLALSHALTQEKTKWLKGWTLVTTLEPCIMCMGALLISRISTLVYGTYDPRWGGVSRILKTSTEERMPEWPLIVPGIMEDECRELIQKFFNEKRNKKAKEL